MFDSVLNTYTQINDTNFVLTLDANNYNDRFFITFDADDTLSTDVNILDSIRLYYLNDTKELDITLSNTVKLSQEILQFWVDREYDNLHFQTLKKLLVNKLHNEK